MTFAPKTFLGTGSGSPTGQTWWVGSSKGQSEHFWVPSKSETKKGGYRSFSETRSRLALRSVGRRSYSEKGEWAGPTLGSLGEL